MYKIMIVDDEPLILAGIASLLQWEDYGCKIIGKAVNGRQALEMMKEQKPDIIITDIKMPAMDGISFMKFAKEIGADAVFVFLTNLEEFSLVKEAIRLGAVDYLVKLELDEKKMEQTLKRALEQCDLIRVSKGQGNSAPVYSEAEQIKMYFERIIRDEPEESMEDAFTAMLERHFRLMVLVLVNLNFGYDGFTPAFTHRDQMKVMGVAEDIISEMVKYDFDESCVIRRGDSSFLIILSADGQGDYKNQIKNMERKFISVLKDYFEVSISVAASMAEKSTEFSALLYQVTTAMNYAYTQTPGCVVFYSRECEESDRHNCNFDITFLKKDLEQVIVQNDGAGLSYIINQVAGLLEEYKPTRLQAVHACMNLYYYITSFFEKEEDPSFPYAVNIMEQLNRTGNLSEMVQWLEGFGRQAVSVMEQKKNTKLDRYVELAKGYIEDHMEEKITLGAAAKHLDISQGYLSSIFKKQTGQGFSDYVMERKIKKAKEFIKEQKYMMYEISDRLGFDNQFYFSTVFKKVTGCTPKEFEAGGREC